MSQDLLARSAAGLYWMSRYLSRVENLSRLLYLQTEALSDRPVRDIHFGWTRIYRALGREPPWGVLDQFEDDDYLLADSFTLAGDLTFEETNPSSIRACLGLGRDNARQMRQHISAAMWTQLNLAYLGIRDLTIEAVWRLNPEGFFAETEATIHKFWGVTAATMYRGDGWRFIQLGNLVERVQMISGLLVAQSSALEESGEGTDADWISLLRQFHARAAYNQRFGLQIDPGKVLSLLIADPQLPGSLLGSLLYAQTHFHNLEAGPDANAVGAARESLGFLTQSLAGGWTAPSHDRAQLLAINEAGRELHERINSAFFDYPIEDAPRA
ncbi:MAG: alpha-E domain-containing protein [Chloroflexi bacterium]|nr:alpha-E domain-containing protein [Chloroflexota bacterium]MDE2936190.1 alpha-E domain-containing protein [Chloroflexota bacterium]MXY00572.1 alpha-E domain-containing protein [Chloroflexota bacterium]MYB17241.1 alpha-E domain-containing protein [Chloroflexota bacterium]